MDDLIFIDGHRGVFDMAERMGEEGGESRARRFLHPARFERVLVHNFFGLHNPGAALVEIIFLWLAIVATIVAFSKISRPAAWLLVPYVLWVSFAAYLNYSIWILN